jgi:hypothetical protein
MRFSTRCFFFHGSVSSAPEYPIWAIENFSENSRIYCIHNFVFTAGVVDTVTLAISCLVVSATPTINYRWCHCFC